MKKNILLKIVLAFVMLTLILSLVACKKPTPDLIDPLPQEESVIDQLVGIIKGADGLIKTLNNVTADGNLTADIDLGVNQKVGSTTNAFVLGVKGNINKSNPELAINFKDNGKEQLALGYKGSKVYLKQPLTTMNKNADGSAATAPDAMVADVTALNPSIADGMSIIMDLLADVNFALDLDKLGDDIGDMLTDDMDLSALIVFKQLTNGNRLEITEDTVDLLKSLVLNKLLTGTMGEVADTLVNTLFKTEEGIEYLLKSNIYVEVYKDSEGVINRIKLGFTASDDSTGDIDIVLNKFNSVTDNKATIAFGSEYTAKSADLGLELALPQKEVTANLGVKITPDFSAENKVLASGGLTFTDLKASENNTYTIPAYFNGTSAYFNTANIYTGINAIACTNLITAPEDTLYSASIYEKNADGSFKANQSLIKLINTSVSKAKTDYIANKDVVGEEAGPSKGIVNSIYELFGGELTTTTDKDGVTTYNKTTEDAMLKQLNTKFGDYTRFVIYNDVKGDLAVKTYDKVIKSVTALFDANKAWIIGTKTQNEAGDYGIMDWSKENWSGGANLYKTGPENDLLDVVNVFLCNGKTGTTPNDVTTADIADFANYYVSMLHYYTTDDQAYITSVDAADRNLLVAKNIYQASDKKSAAKTALDTAKDAYKLAMEKAMFGEGETKDYSIANNLISQILGVDNASENVLKDLIDGGVYVGIASVKGQGLNGNLFIASDKAQATTYLTIAGTLALSDVAAAANIEVLDGAVELASVYELGTTDKYKKIDKWEDGTKKVITNEADGIVGDYIYVMDGDDFIYETAYPNAADLIDQLKAIYEAYLVMDMELD